MFPVSILGRALTEDYPVRFATKASFSHFDRYRERLEVAQAEAPEVQEAAAAPRRLLASLIEPHRSEGKVRHEQSDRAHKGCQAERVRTPGPDHVRRRRSFPEQRRRPDLPRVLKKVRRVWRTQHDSRHPPFDSSEMAK